MTVTSHRERGVRQQLPESITTLGRVELSPGAVDRPLVGRHHVEVRVDIRQHRGVGSAASEEDGTGVELRWFEVAEERAQAHLGVEVDHQGACAGGRECVGQVERQRRLAGPALRMDRGEDVASAHSHISISADRARCLSPFFAYSHICRTADMHALPPSAVAQRGTTVLRCPVAHRRGSMPPIPARPPARTTSDSADIGRWSGRRSDAVCSHAIEPITPLRVTPACLGACPATSDRNDWS